MDVLSILLVPDERPLLSLKLFSLFDVILLISICQLKRVRPVRSIISGPCAKGTIFERDENRQCNKNAISRRCSGSSNNLQQRQQPVQDLQAVALNPALSQLACASLGLLVSILEASETCLVLSPCNPVTPVTKHTVEAPHPKPSQLTCSETSSSCRVMPILVHLRRDS